MNKNSKAKYRCPRCKTNIIIEHDDLIHCPKCARDFDKNLLGVVEDEYILSHQEMEKILNAFTEEEKKNLFENEL